MSEPKVGDVFLHLMSDRSEQYCIIEGEAGGDGWLYSTLSGNKTIYPLTSVGYGFFLAGSANHKCFEVDENLTELVAALREQYESL